MIRKILGRSLATLAIGTLAFAAQDGVPLPVVKEPAIHIYRVDMLRDRGIMGAGDLDVGQFEALVVDSNSGRIAYAVVSQGGAFGLGERKRLVPWIALYFSVVPSKDGDDCEIRTLLTKEQVEDCPKFKQGELISADNECSAFKAAKLPQDQNIGEGTPERLLCSLDIANCAVRDNSKLGIGKIERLLVDPFEGCVAYTVLNMDDKLIALPWQVTRASLDKERKLSLTTSVTKKSLAEAPRYFEDEWKRMTSSTWLHALATFHGVAPYWVRTTPAANEPAGQQR